MKRFNITGTCYPEDHYMVNIDDRLNNIAKLVAEGQYITINRGRQYGKTTTLYHLAERLSGDYVVFSISFEALTDKNFANTGTLAYSFLEQIQSKIEFGVIKNLNDTVTKMLDEKIASNAEKKEIPSEEFDKFLSVMCAKSSKSIVVFIDEVDNASNYESFIELLRLLRNKYLNRKTMPTFQSVILAGVYDIKNLKLKVRPDSEHQYNSPWNIAIPLKSDMSFAVPQIAQMLSDYEADHKTGMDIDEIASLIHDYTNGYPVLVSKICQLIDEENLGWDQDGVQNAVKLILNERNNTFFSDLVKKLDDFPEIRKMLKDMLYYGKEFTFNPDNKVLNIAAMFNYISNINGKVKITNRIIETRLYNLFMSEEEMTSTLYGEGQTDRDQFIDGKTLKMDKILERFAFHFNDIYGSKDLTFKEEEGRRFFMLYIRPIINGTGHYYIEAETRDRSRTDMIIDYNGIQYIIEMKIWRGESYNERGENQLSQYLDYYHIDKGYMLSFCFNKNKVPGGKSIKIGDKEIYEVVV